LVVDRRYFLASALGSLTLAGWPRAAFSDVKSGKIVVIVLEGGMDGLAAVPPVGDAALFDQRRELVPKNLLEIDKYFALNPALYNFNKFLKAGMASIVHATNMPYRKRSHFEGQNIMESGISTPFAVKTGWLGRALDLLGLSGEALSLDLPLLLRGNRGTNTYYPAKLKKTFDPDPIIARYLADVRFGKVSKTFQSLSYKKNANNLGARRDPISLAKHAASEMRKAAGPKAAVVRVKRFDTHANQGADSGLFFSQLRLVDKIFETLQVSLEEDWKNTIVVTLTEFGRTVAMNGSLGTDHGYGSVGLLAGGSGFNDKVITDWPGLKKADLHEGRDLMATLDYRSVLSACLEKSFGLSHDLITEKVFRDPMLPRFTDTIFPRT